MRKGTESLPLCMRTRHGSDSGLVITNQLQNGGPKGSHDADDVFHANCKVNAANNTLPVLKDVFYLMYTEFSRLETSSSKDMAVPNQLGYLTLSEVIHVSAMPHRNLFVERNGSRTKV